MVTNIICILVHVDLKSKWAELIASNNCQQNVLVD